MTPSFDTIVVGLGAMGSSAAYHLAQRGHRVLGLDRFSPPHRLGSSHGKSRAIRLAYFEDPAYVPLLRRSYELWHRLEQDSGRSLLQETGTLMLGPADSPVVSGSLASALEHDLEHELLDASDLRRRFPALAVSPETCGLFEKAGGVLGPEAAIQAHLDLAGRAGASLRFDCPALGWTVRSEGDGVQVRTAERIYEAEHLVLASGAWSSSLLDGQTIPLQVARHVMFWFAPQDEPERFSPGNLPVWVWAPPEEPIFYGFPAVSGKENGVKVGLHTGGTPCDPVSVERTVTSADLETLRVCLEGRLPLDLSDPIKSCVCFYTNTSDGHFVLGLLPDQPQVVLAAGFSGHGFKFAGLIGEVVADLVDTGGTSHSVDLFSPWRFSQRPPTAGRSAGPADP